MIEGQEGSRLTELVEDSLLTQIFNQTTQDNNILDLVYMYIYIYVYKPP